MRPLNSDHIRKTEICFRRFLNLSVALPTSLPHTEMCSGPEPRKMEEVAHDLPQRKKPQKMKPTNEQQKTLL